VGHEAVISGYSIGVLIISLLVYDLGCYRTHSYLKIVPLFSFSQSLSFLVAFFDFFYRYTDKTMVGIDVGFPDCAKRNIDVSKPKNGMKKQYYEKLRYLFLLKIKIL
jgi:hypothetical protein